jgi:hypothetical protein
VHIGFPKSADVVHTNAIIIDDAVWSRMSNAIIDAWVVSNPMGTVDEEIVNICTKCCFFKHIKNQLSNH